MQRGKNIGNTLRFLTQTNYRYAVSATELTSSVDLQLTEVCSVNGWKLHDDVSVRLHVGSTRQAHCGPFSNGARILTADGVVPESRCRDSG